MLQNKLLSRVVLTISYSSVFSFPLNTQEVWLRLVGQQASLDQVKLALARLIQLNLIKLTDGYWSCCLSSKSQKKFRLKRRLTSQKKLKQATPVLKLAQKLPWVRAVVITGSVAIKNAKDDDDVDFLIITTNHGLWLTRLIFTWYAQIKGKRRTFSKEEKNSWCFNLWLTNKQLTVPEDKRSLYSAYDLFQAFWWLDKDNLKSTFLAKNLWARVYLPNYFNFSWQSIDNNHQVGVEKLVSLTLLDWLLLVLNVLTYIGQRVYMQRHLTSERVGYGMAYFHPRNTKGLIYSRWQKLIKQWLDL